MSTTVELNNACAERDTYRAQAIRLEARVQELEAANATDCAKLLEFLFDLCDSHIKCSACGRAACDECHEHFPSLIADRHACSDGNDDMCEVCWQECGPCRDEAARESWAESRADMERYGA